MPAGDRLNKQDAGGGLRFLSSEELIIGVLSNAPQPENGMCFRSLNNVWSSNGMCCRMLHNLRMGCVSVRSTTCGVRMGCAVECSTT